MAAFSNTWLFFNKLDDGLFFDLFGLLSASF